MHPRQLMQSSMLMEIFLISELPFFRFWCCYFCGSTQVIGKSHKYLVSATGAPLDIAGRATLSLSLSTFTNQHEFTVVHHLAVDCLPGADFLRGTE